MNKDSKEILKVTDHLDEITELIEEFKSVRSYSKEICKTLTIEDHIPQAAEFVSPPKWHLAHTTWFFEEMILKKYNEKYKVFNKDFSFLFNSYYQTVGKRAKRNFRGVMTRPSVKEVYLYRKIVDAHIEALLSLTYNEEIIELITLGIQHEQQHQELLLTDIKYMLSLNPVNPVYKKDFDLTQDKNMESGWLTIEKGIYSIGYDGDGFCFDNELGHHKVFLADYEIAKSLVTNGEFMEFMEAGGYENFKFWLDEGWSWVNENNIKSPLYWEEIDEKWHHFTLAGLKTIDKNAILCHVSFYEAQAYATWKRMRLPTEFEWEAASKHLKWGKRWEWTYSSYLPYPGFKIAEGAVGEYNGKFMINQMVLRGASVATAPAHLRNTCRNFFHPIYRWQFNGIRLAK